MKRDLLHVTGRFKTSNDDVVGLKLAVQEPRQPGHKPGAPQDLLLTFDTERMGELIQNLFQLAHESATPAHRLPLQNGEPIPQGVAAAWSAVLKDDDGSPLLLHRLGRATLALPLSRDDARQIAHALLAAAESPPPTAH